MATVVAGVLIAILMGPLHAVSVVVGFGLIGITLGHAFRNQYGPVKSMVLGFTASLLSKAAIIAIGFAIFGTNPLTFQGTAMTEALEQAVGIYRSMGIPEEQLAQMSENMKDMLSLMQIILPVGLAGAAVVDTYLNFWASKAVLKRMGQQVEAFPPIKKWTFPRAVVFLFAGAMGAVYFGKAQDIILLYNIGINICIFAMLILGVQGLALFYFLAEKYNLSKLIRTVILFLIFTNGLMFQMLIFVGIYDVMTDYRQLRAPR